jgi:hypothetical protein
LHPAAGAQIHGESPGGHGRLAGLHLIMLARSSSFTIVPMNVNDLGIGCANSLPPLPNTGFLDPPHRRGIIEQLSVARATETGGGLHVAFSYLRIIMRRHTRLM